MPFQKNPARLVADKLKLFKAPGVLNSVVTALLAGGVTFLAATLVHFIALHWLFHFPLLVFADNFLVALTTGAIVFLYERRHVRHLLDRLLIIQEMNHHVRNALQAISFSVHQYAENKRLQETIRESSERIDWALREILQGKTNE